MFAKACHKITRIIEKKLVEDEKSPITEDERIMMKELCITLSTVMKNVCKFNWNSLITDEGDPEIDKKDHTKKEVKTSKEDLE